MCNYFVMLTEQPLHTCVCANCKEYVSDFNRPQGPIGEGRQREYCALFQSKEQIPKVSLYKKKKRQFRVKAT